jgi:DUF4097 and DUF4098 domain-containing protein YvlB
MKKWPIVGILGISLFAICLGGIVAFVPVVRQLFSGDIQWNLLSVKNFSADAVEELRAPVDGPAELKINTPFGKVDVAAEEGTGEVFISAHKYAWGINPQGAEDLLQKIKIVVDQNGNSVNVYVDQPVEVDILHIGPAGISVDFTVRVPVECAVDASSSSGDIRVEGTTGTAVLHSSFGKVSAEKIRGDVTATTSSGDVTLMDVSAGDGSVDAVSSFGEVLVQSAQGGILKAKSSSGEVTVKESEFTGRADLSTSFGDISASGVKARALDARTNSGKVVLQSLEIGDDLTAHSDFGDVQVKASSAQSYDLDTNSGKITADDTSGRVKARSGFGDINIRGAGVILDLSTSSGSIEFHGSLGDGASTLRTNFGDIRIYLPENAEFDVDLSTDFGSIECSFAVTSTSHESTHLVGRVGAGGPMLKASTNSGSVRVQPQPAE